MDRSCDGWVGGVLLGGWLVWLEAGWVEGRVVTKQIVIMMTNLMVIIMRVCLMVMMEARMAIMGNCASSCIAMHGSVAGGDDGRHATCCVRCVAGSMRQAVSDGFGCGTKIVLSLKKV